MKKEQEMAYADLGLPEITAEVELGDPRCPYPRPPGALPEESFLMRCDKCDLCVDACARSVLRRHPDDGTQWAGTPVLDVNRTGACGLCGDQPCSAACPSGALVPKTRAEVFIGMAWIDKERCLAWRGSACELCALACPLAELKIVDGVPVIDEVQCKGCGNCRDACPLDPPAIEVLY